jgi:hypothetical protein
MELPLVIRAILQPEMPYRLDILGHVWTPIAYFALHHYMEMLLSNGLFKVVHTSPLRVMHRRWIWSEWQCVMSIEPLGHGTSATPEWLSGGPK